MNVCIFSLPGNCDIAPQGLSKFTHLSDGNIDLVLVKKCDRKDFIRFLRRHGNSKNQVGKEVKKKKYLHCLQSWSFTRFLSFILNRYIGLNTEKAPESILFFTSKELGLSICSACACSHYIVF